jgi:hypothetical protein
VGRQMTLQRTKAVAGGQASALAVEAIRAWPRAKQQILLGTPEMELLNMLSPIPFITLVNTPAAVRWTLLTCFTDPWGTDTTSEAVTFCSECGSVLFHEKDPRDE